LSRVRNQRSQHDVRNVRLWRALLGVDQRTVIEEIEFEEFEGPTAARWWSPGCGREVGFRGGVAAVSAGHLGMTGARVGAGGVAWIGAPCRWCWRPMRHG
jgi:hypothetical protein